ncbi:hypothetical protein FRB99_005466 [Tulasnella sp. 403]|nr:hypothetical protein FRB99_005466 [Tulasnella sp. 403]
MSSPPETPDSFSLYPKGKAKSLFAESPLLSLRNKTGPGGDDLTLSELSANDTPPKLPSARAEQQRFSLFGAASPGPAEEEEEQTVQLNPDASGSHPNPDTSRQHDESDVSGGYEEDADAVTPQKTRPPVDEDEEHASPRRTKEDDLRTTLYQMQKINGVLMDYLDALKATEENNRVLTQQVENSQQLLKKYKALLVQTEHTSKLLLDPLWQGAEADEIHAAEIAEAEAREREKRLQEEQERLERLERERIEKEAAEQREREARANGHIVVFLLGTVPFPPGYGATIHFEWPGKGFQLLGMLGNEKPSAIFRLRGIWADAQSGGPSSMQATSQMASGDITATIGISIEPLDAIQVQMATIHPLGQAGSTSNQPSDAIARLPDPTMLAERIVKHLFNHLSSYQTGVGPQTLVPLGVIQKWYESLVGKLRAGGVAFLMKED